MDAKNSSYYVYEKEGTCPNCSFPIFLRIRVAEEKSNGRIIPIQTKPEIPTVEDVIVLCPCIKIIHDRAKEGVLIRPQDV